MFRKPIVSTLKRRLLKPVPVTFLLRSKTKTSTCSFVPNGTKSSITYTKRTVRLSILPTFLKFPSSIPFTLRKTLITFRFGYEFEFPTISGTVSLWFPGWTIPLSFVLTSTIGKSFHPSDTYKILLINSSPTEYQRIGNQKYNECRRTWRVWIVNCPGKATLVVIVRNVRIPLT